MAKEPMVLESLKKLRSEPEAISWTKRRELGSMLGKLFESGKGDENAVALATLLASDRRWEVRKSVANFLSHMPEEAGIRLIAQLLSDDNAFVRKAVDRVIEHRRRTQKSRVRQQRGLEQVREGFADLEKSHGAGAVKKSRKIVQHMYEALARSASHELLGRMTPLKSDTAQLLAKAKSKQLDMAEAERTLRDIAERLDFYERFLLNLKVYSQTLPDERTRENLADVVAESRQQALDKLRASAVDSKKVAFNSTIPDNLYVDMARLPFVVALSDLIKNAFEAFKGFTPPRGVPTVSVEGRRMTDEFVQIKISDNGCGIAANDLADVREFIPGKSSKKVQGTGFGVPNARRIFLEHNGEFDIQSSPDHGTCVMIKVPLRKKDEPDEA